MIHSFYIFLTIVRRNCDYKTLLFSAHYLPYIEHSTVQALVLSKSIGCLLKSPGCLFINYGITYVIGMYVYVRIYLIH